MIKRDGLEIAHKAAGPALVEATMGDVDLTIATILRYGAQTFPESTVVTCAGGAESRTASFAAVAGRAAQLAHGLRHLGVGPGDRVATLLFNTQEHQEAYLGVPAMGAVLHTLNFRLPPEHLVHVVNDAQDVVIVCEAMLYPIAVQLLPKCPSVRSIVVVDGEAADLAGAAVSYASVLGDHPTTYDWPDLSESTAAGMCYTSGTTGKPKGVVYSHRSTYLHALTFLATGLFTGEDRLLTVVPMFHVNAWGAPYAAWMNGADLLMPGPFMQAAPLCEFIESHKVTVSAGVPTVWADVLRHARTATVDLSTLRSVIIGGAAVPVSMIEAFRDEHRVRIHQAWGMTETSPLVCLGLQPKNAKTADEIHYLGATGRNLIGTELRVVDEAGTEVALDGETIGEIQVRGPWITDRYHGVDAPDSFCPDDGGRTWLRTGDLATIDSERFVRICDRAKDVIKSGGEWISSVELEEAISTYPDVLEAAVIAVPDDRWDERPLAIVVSASEALPDPQELCSHLKDLVPRWWIPERWAFLDELPRGSTFKIEKRRLRDSYAAGNLPVVLSHPTPKERA